MARRHRVELTEHCLLELHALGHRLDDEVDLAEALIGRRGGDELQDHRILSHLARAGQPRVDEALIDVLEQDGNAGGGDDLGDLAAHGAGTHDGGLEDEHGDASLSSGAQP